MNKIINRKTLLRYVDKFCQDEYSEMNLNFIFTSVARLSAKKVGQRDKEKATQWFLIPDILMQ